jgi:hypothetical protein
MSFSFDCLSLGDFFLDLDLKRRKWRVVDQVGVGMESGILYELFSWPSFTPSTSPSLSLIKADVLEEVEIETEAIEKMKEL